MMIDSSSGLWIVLLNWHQPFWILNSYQTERLLIGALNGCKMATGGNCDIIRKRAIPSCWPIGKGGLNRKGGLLGHDVESEQGRQVYVLLVTGCL